MVNSVTGTGIAGVKVDLGWAGDTYYSTTTDARGRFRFDHVQDGAYRAAYSAPDYESIDLFRTPGSGQVRVTAGGNPVKLEGHMMPMGSLSGRVIDTSGQAVAKAIVVASATGLQMGVETDAQGKFAMHQLGFPGAYTVSATPPPGLKPPHPEPGSDVVLGWRRTWYPGVAVPEGATKVVLPPGGEVGNIEIKLLEAKAHAVRGVLLHPDGKPASKVEITLDSVPQPGLRAESKADGTFEFPVVVDGEWRLAAEMERGGVKLQACQWIDMAGRERDGVRLQLNAPFTVRARLVMELPQGLQAPPSNRMGLERADRFHGLPRGPTVFANREADGSLTMQPVYPGTYFVNAMPAPGYYLDAMRLGGAELTSLVVELSSGALPITVVYKANGGTVRGTVEQCGYGGVMLEAQDPAERWRDWARPARCDANGRYEITGVRPGEYYAVATTADPSSSLWDPSWDDRMIDRAAKVTVRAGEASSADLRAIARPPY